MNICDTRHDLWKPCDLRQKFLKRISISGYVSQIPIVEKIRVFFKQNIMDGETQIGISVQLAGGRLQTKYKKFQEYEVGNSSILLPNLYDTFHSY